MHGWIQSSASLKTGGFGSLTGAISIIDGGLQVVEHGQDQTRLRKASQQVDDIQQISGYRLGRCMGSSHSQCSQQHAKSAMLLPHHQPQSIEPPFLPLLPLQRDGQYRLHICSHQYHSIQRRCLHNVVGVLRSCRHTLLGRTLLEIGDKRQARAADPHPCKGQNYKQ